MSQNEKNQKNEKSEHSDPPTGREISRVVNVVCDALEGLPAESQRRVLHATAALLGLQTQAAPRAQQRQPQQQQQQNRNGGR